MSMGEVLIDFIVADEASSLATARAFVARAGGAPANVSVALSRLGLQSAFCGVVGSDAFGDRIGSELQAEGVDVSRVRQSSKKATTLAFAWKNSRGDGHFWLLRGADTELEAADAEQAGIAGLAALVVGSVSFATQPSAGAIERALEIAKSSNVPVVFDVNLRPTVWADIAAAQHSCERTMRESTLVKLSLDDAIGLFGDGVSPDAALRRVIGLGPEFAVLTDGARGCWFVSKHSSDMMFVESFPVDAIEPTGAGDAFTAGLIVRLFRSRWDSLDVEDVRFAAAAGALATTKRGAWEGLPTLRQLDAFIDSL
jgi:fructokinase